MLVSTTSCKVKLDSIASDTATLPNELNTFYAGFERKISEIMSLAPTRQVQLYPR